MFFLFLQANGREDQNPTATPRRTTTRTCTAAAAAEAEGRRWAGPTARSSEKWAWPKLRDSHSFRSKTFVVTATLKYTHSISNHARLNVTLFWRLEIRRSPFSEPCKLRESRDFQSPKLLEMLGRVGSNRKRQMPPKSNVFFFHTRKIYRVVISPPETNKRKHLKFGCFFSSWGKC